MKTKIALFLARSARVACVTCLVPSALSLAGCGDSATDGGTGGGSGSTGSTGSAGGSGSSSTGGTASTGSSTGTGGGATSCTPLAGKKVDPGCGLFVKPGASGAGTIASPFGTISSAIAANDLASPKPIYVCKGSYAEHVDLPAGTALYGGIDCAAGWAWNASPAEADRTKLTNDLPDTIPLVLSSGSAPSEVFGFSIESKAASAKSASSIAVLADHSTTTFAFVSMQAGDGAPGTDATPNLTAAAAGVAGNPGTQYLGGVFQVCAANNPGGAATPNPMCPTSIGGAGGFGAGTLGMDGGAGIAGLPMGGGGGAGVHCIGATCTVHPGGLGNTGATGSAGTGATGLGTIDAAGFHGVSGGAGGSGAPGGGGGGGGGQVAATCGGDGGGAGGSGGCGGAGGAGGTGGGSSIAIVSLSSTLAFDSCTAVVGHGGKGGNGAAGEPGGAGALGGLGHNAGNGGKGGDGGAGGTGGGGLGGHAIGIAYGGSIPSLSGLTVTPVMAAQAGLGGTGPAAGANGVAAESQQFP